MIDSYYKDILGMKKGGSSSPKYSIKKEVKDRLKKENPKTSFLLIGLSPVTQYRKYKHRQNIKKERARDEGKTKYSKGGMPSKNKKNFRPTKSGAGMTEAGVKAYRRLNPGSKLKTAVTGKVKPGSKDAKRRKSYCARSLGQLKRASAKTRNDPNSRIRQARRRWKC